MEAKGSEWSNGRRPEDICIFAKEQRTDRRCSFMEAHGFFHSVNVEKIGRIAKEGWRTRKGVLARMIGKHPDEEGSGGTGEKKQRNE